MSLQKPNAPLKQWVLIIVPVVVLLIIILIFRGVYPESFAPKDTDISTEQDALADTVPSVLKADDLFSDYMQNKVTFDKKCDDKLIEFQGTVEEISNTGGCSFIKIEVEQDRFYSISCSNCPKDEDKWAEEVAKAMVGDLIVIKGYYSASTSSKYSMDFYKCHIIN